VVRAGAYVVLAVATALVVVVLREETMSVHHAVDPDSELHLVVEASANVAEPDLTDMVSALFLVCQLEVAGEPAAPIVDLGHGRYLLRLRPSLDRSDRQQVTGCLEDSRIDHLQAGVRSIRHIDREHPPSPLPTQG
jgi:hypothetical protein